MTTQANSPSPQVLLRWFQWGAIVLSLCGVGVLWLAAQRVGVPSVAKLADLGSALNLAYVRVQGRVIALPRYDGANRSLQFTLADESGELAVYAQPAEVAALLARDALPRLGDWVVLEGNVRLRATLPSLTLAASEQLQRTPAPVVAQPIAALLGGAPDLQASQITGLVRAVRSPYAGLQLYTLRDASGEIEVALPDLAVLLGGVSPSLNVGDVVQVSGVLTFYRDQPQLTVTDARALVALPPETLSLAPVLSTGAVAAAQVDQLVQLSGTLLAQTPFSAGVKLQLDDGSGAVLVVLWQDIWDEINRVQPLALGDRLQVLGVVSLYRGTVEVLPESAADLHWLGAK